MYNEMIEALRIYLILMCIVPFGFVGVYLISWYVNNK